uniref:Uncharacterized protein n=1 Tax=Anguilla anguilla TaxID=7936 RepID=A0A0E9W6P4_ANGAN
MATLYAFHPIQAALHWPY